MLSLGDLRTMTTHELYPAVYMTTEGDSGGVGGAAMTPIAAASKPSSSMAMRYRRPRIRVSCGAASA
jgi:hypothetical protein